MHRIACAALVALAAAACGTHRHAPFAAADAGPPDAAEPDGGADSGAGDGGADAGALDGGGGCADDALEPDDHRAQAAPLPLGATQLAICPQNDDWFDATLPAGGTLDVRITFPGTADLDLWVYDDGMEVVGVSQARTGGSEHVFVPPRAFAQTLHVRVTGWRGSAAPYELDASQGEGASDACPVDDAFEPDDGPSTAANLPLGTTGGLVVCGVDEDWFSFPAQLGDAVSATASAAGLTVELYEPWGASWRRVAASGGGAASTWAEAGGRWLVRVRRTDAANPGSATYDLALAASPGPGGAQLAVSGTVAYDKVTFDVAKGTAGPVAPGVPVEGALVELVRDADGRVLASAATGAQGGYALAAANHGDPGVHVRLTATRHDQAVHADVVSAPTAATRALYAFASPSFTASPGAPVDFRFAFDTAGAAAMNILANLSRTFAAAARLVGPDLPTLAVNWQRGAAQPCITCYDRREVELSGLLTDHDEWDDDVLLHETGHFVADMASADDSPGGLHDGSPTSPTLAWSEGWATFWAQAVDGQPVYSDASWDGSGTVVTGMVVEDVENHDCAPGDETACGFWQGGALTTSLEGQVSEFLVSDLLWDLADAHDDAGDVVSAGAGAVCDPFAAYLPSALAARAQVVNGRTYKGIDLVDFLDGWYCRGEGYDAGMRLLLSYREVPYDYAGPARCP